MVRRFLEFLDARTSHRSDVGALFESPLPGGAHWARTFGALALILFGLEAITGLGLSAWYAPTTSDAWATVHFINNQLVLGWVLRGVHHVAGNVLIVVAILHLIQGLLWGAWKAPRELSWVAGLVALQALILVSHTGYLLPWDLRAYWATQVLVGITGNQPIVGELAAQLVQGGPAVGNTTLTHLYSMHVLLTPGLFAGAVALQLWLKRRHGELAPAAMAPDRAAEKAQTYFPYQASRDLTAAVVVLLGIILWVVREHGVPLGAPADPSIEYVARPEWYFLPIFYLRHFYTGSQEFIATTVFPGVGVTFLAALPFLYHWLSKTRKNAGGILVGMSLLGMLGAFVLGALIAYEDATDAQTEKINARADEFAQQAQQLAMIGVPVAGPLELYKNDPLVWGKRVFDRECAACHAPATMENYDAALCLDGYASRTWTKKFMRDPRSKYFFGSTKIDEMDAYDGDEEKLNAIVEYLYLQSGKPDVRTDLAQTGARLYEKEGCAECHLTDPADTGEYPNLMGWASQGWLEQFIRQPDHARFYGQANEMDSFDVDKLSKDELKAVIHYLRNQTDEKAKF